MTAMLGYKGIEGLSSIIRASGDVMEMAARHIRASGVEGLDVLPSGPRPSNPAELLTSARLAELLAWTETVYDRVVIDSPPSLAASDSAVVGRMVDGVVLVVQPDKNRRRLVLRAAEGLTAMGVTLLGVVLNRVGADRDRGYYGYGGGYEYHYGYGGEEEPELRPTRLDGPAAVELPVPEPHYARPVATEDANPSGTVPRRVR
jgi:capsular exopolysaccharide synthesis family protein